VSLTKGTSSIPYQQLFQPISSFASPSSTTLTSSSSSKSSFLIRLSGFLGPSTLSFPLERLVLRTDRSSFGCVSDCVYSFFLSIHRFNYFRSSSPAVPVFTHSFHLRCIRWHFPCIETCRGLRSHLFANLPKYLASLANEVSSVSLPIIYDFRKSRFVVHFQRLRSCETCSWIQNQHHLSSAIPTSL